VVLGGEDPRPPWGRFVHQKDEPFPEPLTTLAVIAGSTKTIRLLTAILIAPLRPPVLLAKTAATLHSLSNGRLVLGISTSWHEEEYAALGVPFEERGQRLDDAVGACRALWSSSPASFESKTISFEHIYCEPRPASPEDIPVWFTGKMRRQLVRRVAEYGHGWLPFIGMDTPLAPFKDEIATLKQAMRQAGRNADKLEVAVRFRTMGRSLEQAFEEDMPLMAETGITQAHVPLLSLVPSLDEAPKAIEHLARLFEPFRQL
jgi:probable F420-dependent oxidoreductase